MPAQRMRDLLEIHSAIPPIEERPLATFSRFSARRERQSLKGGLLFACGMVQCANTFFFGESQMTPEEQAQLGLNGFFAYKGFSVRPGPATMKRIGNKSRPTIQYWTARPDRGTQATDAGTVGAIKAWIDKQTKK
jgi:hypothetical protein